MNTAVSLHNKTIFLTGGSRGIGLEIALRAAQDGANIVVAAKTAQPHPKLEGTIYTAAEAIKAAGGDALPLILDVRDESAVEKAVSTAAEHFGGIDICINNASAIALSNSIDTETKRFDLIQQINMRGTFLVSRACIPWLKKSDNAHVLTLSPPLDLRPDWLANHLPYTISKYNMSLITLGMAEEFKAHNIAFNSLWPKSTIATAAVKFALGGDEMMRRSRKPQIMADAAHYIFSQDAKEFTGNLLLDEDLLNQAGKRDFSEYRVDANSELEIDLFVAEPPKDLHD